MSRKEFTFQADVSISDLLLDESNPRIRSAKDQSECIARILKKEKQMLNLIKNIAINGLSITPILVTSSDVKGKWVVKDGNRRVTALKLLNEPSLCSDERVRQQVESIAGSKDASFENVLDCYSSDSQSALAREIKLRHSGELDGVGQTTWSAYLRTVYELTQEQSTNYKRAGQYLLWAEDHGIDVEDEFPISTVHRFFSNKNIELLGFNTSNDDLILTCELSAAKTMAREIIDDLGTGRKKVDDLFTGDAARSYLNQVRINAGLSKKILVTNVTHSGSDAQRKTFHSKEVHVPKNYTVAMDAPSGSPLQGLTNARAGRKPSKPNWDRKKLFWTGAKQPSVSVGVSTFAEKMRAIFYEVAQIKDVRESPLTTAFLIRAMIELSEKHFRTANNLQDKNSLAENISAACDTMYNKAFLNKSQVDLVKSYTVSKRPEVGIFTVDTLQKYLHRETHKPSPQTINIFWDEIHPFVHACWK